MHVLVTGAAGFIATEVIRALLAAGHQVRALDALIPSVHPAQTVPAFPNGVEFVYGDVRDADTVAAALRGIDVVCHHAAMVGRGKEIMDAPLYTGCNDVGTAVLLAEMTRAHLCRLVLASSVVIYGDSIYRCVSHGVVRPPPRAREDLDAGRFEPRCPRCGAEVVAWAVTEEHPLDPPRNVYAISKLSQEYLAGAWVRETPGSAIALRYHNVYGPGMSYHSPYSGVAAAFRSHIEAGCPPRVYEDGGSRRDFVHVRDVASANVAAITHRVEGLRTYNIASGDPRPILDVARALSEATGAPEPEVTGQYRIGDVRHIVASPRRARDEFCWRPAIGFDAGMKEFATAPMRQR
jgi:dTDP-L-rhamnose 4-epimerase